MDKKQFLESGLLEQYVLGLTNAEENALVERFAAAFPEIQQEIEGLQNSLEAYAKEYAIAPPEDLKNQILEKIDRLESPAPSKKVTSNGLSLVLAVSLAILSAIAATFFYQKWNNQQEAYNRLQSEFAAFQEKCQNSRQELAASNQVLNFLKHPATQPVFLKGTSLFPASAAVVYWNPQAQNAYLSILNLPPPPPEKQYQIWADVDGVMVDMGVLDAASPELQLVNFIEHPESFNITLEPKGGSEHPNVQQLYANGGV